MGIVAEQLVKRFEEADEDKPPAVSGLSFVVEPGEVYGLIGPNGAGKTTTMRMLVGLMVPTAGRATIAGRDLAVDGIAARRRVGFVSGSMGLYERLNVRELLRYQAQLYGMSRREADQRIDELAELLQFRHLIGRRSGGLSTGEKQRVALARASLHDPPALIFDEPTAGLDVLASRFVADFIRSCRDRGRAVLFSTHYMTEAELLCDRIGLLHRGRLLAEGAASELKERLGADTLEEVFLRLHDRRGEEDEAKVAAGPAPAADGEETPAKVAAGPAPAAADREADREEGAR